MKSKCHSLSVSTVCFAYLNTCLTLNLLHLQIRISKKKNLKLCTGSKTPFSCTPFSCSPPSHSSFQLSYVVGYSVKLPGSTWCTLSEKLFKVHFTDFWTMSYHG